MADWFLTNQISDRNQEKQTTDETDSETITIEAPILIAFDKL